MSLSVMVGVASANPYRYVGLGDSYSSGEGTYNYYSSHSCHKSPDSYIQQVAQEFNLGTPHMAACSGATTYDLFNADPVTGEPAQIDAFSSTTELATLTIGGNDLGFAQVIDECTERAGHNGFGCSTGSWLPNAVNDRMSALKGSMPANAPDGNPIINLVMIGYDVLGMMGSPNKKLFFAGYPRLFGSNPAYFDNNPGAPSGKSCQMTLGATIDYDDAQWMNAKVDELNNEIATMASNMQMMGVPVYYVPPTYFINHEVCGLVDPWINDVHLDFSNPFFPKPKSESLHPTAYGQEHGYGQAFIDTINYYS